MDLRLLKFPMDIVLMVHAIKTESVNAEIVLVAPVRQRELYCN